MMNLVGRTYCLEHWSDIRRALKGRKGKNENENKKGIK